MTAARLAFLVGLFVAPAILLHLGHRFRERDDRHRRRFWGGVIGHLVGSLVSFGALLAPPVAWAGESVVRDLSVHWAMLVGFMIGVLLAPTIGRQTARP
jgi:hypothetical protein